MKHRYAKVKAELVLMCPRVSGNLWVQRAFFQDGGRRVLLEDSPVYDRVWPWKMPQPEPEEPEFRAHPNCRCVIDPEVFE
jgi:hypothetical protein